MGSVASTQFKEVKPSCDVFRDTPLRLLGYSKYFSDALRKNRLRSFAHILPMVSTTYICGDVFHKTQKSSENGNSSQQVLIDSAEAIIWQTFATAIVPGLILDRLKGYVTTTADVWRKRYPLSTSLRVLPRIVGILAVPIIYRPIDLAVTSLVNNTKSIFEDKKLWIE